MTHDLVYNWNSILKNKSYEKTITEFYAFLNQVLFKNILDNVEIFGILWINIHLQNYIFFI